MMRNLSVFALLLVLGISPAGAQTIGGPVSGGGGGSGPPSGTAGGILGGTYPNPTIAAVSTLSPATSGTLDNYVIGGVIPLAGNFTTIGATTRGTGLFTTLGANSTTTFADLATWGTSGLGITSTYTNTLAAIIGVTPTFSYSTTANGINEFVFSATLVPTGATAGTNSTILVNPTMGTSAVDISRIAALQVGVNTAAGYSGVPANGTAILVAAPTAAGTNPFTVGNSITINGATNGGSITSGSVTNTQLNIVASTAAGGVGGTVANTGITIAMPSASSASTTNKGLSITGNGGAASTNFAINSTSTAASTLSGNLTATSLIPSSSTIPTNGLYLPAGNDVGIAANSTKVFDCVSTGCTNTGTFAATGIITTAATDASSSTGGAVQISGGASVAKRFWIPAITGSAGVQTAVLCQSSGGEMIADTVACLASSARFKIIHGPMPYGALDKIAALPIERWSYKAEGIFQSEDWTRERIGAVAEDVAALDTRLVGYDREGKPRSISTEQLLALTIKAVQELKMANDNLRSEVNELRRQRN